MSSTALKAEVEDLVDQRLKAHGLLPGKSCDRCEHYHEGVCELFGAPIPAEFIEKGCDEWLDIIPF